MDAHVVLALRNKIIHKFCRTILWVDDEIDLLKGLGGENSLFRDKFDEFTSEGLLCHLKGFPPAGEGNDPYVNDPVVENAINACVRLAYQADVVIVDWELGDGTTSKHAKRIVNAILGKDKGFRFVVILSKKDLPNTVFADLDSPFEQVGDSGDLLVNKTGQFLLSLKKSNFGNTKLFGRICGALSSAYSDYFHLAAMEIVGKIRDCVPSWFSSIPKNADLGVLIERGNAMYQRDEGKSVYNECWNEDLQECIVRNLIEDLESVVLSERLCSLKENVLKPSNHVPLPYAISRRESLSDDVNNGLQALKDCLKENDCSEFNEKHYRKLSVGVPDDDIKKLVDEIGSFSEFCDERSGCNVSGSRPCPGAVFKGLIDSNSADLFVCISSACDCIRSESLLFLRGEPISLRADVAIPDYASVSKIKGFKTLLRINGHPYMFRSVAHCVLPKSRNELDSLKVVGVVRMDALNRLISRFMAQTQRYGVNQPSLVRKLRKPEGDL